MVEPSSSDSSSSDEGHDQETDHLRDNYGNDDQDEGYQLEDVASSIATHEVRDFSAFTVS